MIKLNFKHHIGLYLNQIKYEYIVFKNNQAVGEAFTGGFRVAPFAFGLVFIQKHFVFPILFITCLTLISLMNFWKPLSFAKIAPQKFIFEKNDQKEFASAQSFSVEKSDQKELVSAKRAPVAKNNPEELVIARLPDNNLGDLPKKEFRKSETFEPVTPNPVISREDFLDRPSAYTLVVSKRTKKLFVTEEIEKGYLVIKEYPVSLGKIPGNKEKKGDKKTPEGVYSLIDLKTRDELPSKYGPYAAILNYPNNKDLNQGKTGTGIWIHGTGKGQLTPDTQGCIELSDTHLTELYAYIGKGAKVIIMPKRIDIAPKSQIIQPSLIKLATLS